MDLVADENVPRAMVERLRADGHAVVAISEIATGIPDTEVAAISSERAFVLLTHDRDFGELVIARGLPIAGVILLETERLALPAQVQRVAACLADAQMVWAGKFSVIEPARIRQTAL